MLEKVQENMGKAPDKASADSGFCSEDNLKSESLKEVDLYISLDKEKHSNWNSEGQALKSEAPIWTEAMRQKLKTEAGRAIYKMRKAIVEPVFGQIKESRGIRRFSFRGLENVTCEWALICMTHNLLKLFRRKTVACNA